MLMNPSVFTKIKTQRFEQPLGIDCCFRRWFLGWNVDTLPDNEDVLFA